LNRAVANFGAALFVDCRCGVQNNELYVQITKPFFEKEVIALKVDDLLLVGYTRTSQWFQQYQDALQCYQQPETSKCQIPTPEVNAEQQALIKGGGPGKCSLQHAYRLATQPLPDVTKDPRERICLGIPTMTSRPTPIPNLSMMQTLLSPNSFLATIHKDQQSSFWYTFYIGFDEFDPTFDSDAYFEFKKEFARRTAGYAIDLHLLRYPPVSGDNVYLWNHLMAQAYADGCDYFYQLCDDIQFYTPGWSEGYVNYLKSRDPPNFGMIGYPVVPHLISQPFVHRTHIEIFGTFYPPVFKNWYGDTWLCNIYPGENMKRETAYSIYNTQVAGVRYTPCGHGDIWAVKIREDQKKLQEEIVVYRARAKANKT